MTIACNYKPSTGPMKKILVVDDNEDILFMLKNYFKLKGYEVTVSLSCHEALSIFYAVQPDLVLLDVNVGHEDGRVMCREIKSRAEYQHIPVILISANSEGLVAYEKHGANAAVEKPFNFPYLVSIVELHTQASG
jgi:two-component system sensor histidine kinase ChiS